eukprot:TRINITY_DN16465_c1_g1_i5.p1 TRINITY_DN16465_c1_g1~~TRINITY_DN16465_c1_g1_i5.p1  ORF type:complete len:254 (-),score=40.64 TRINITY_DN16465_c1_g1_i5:38-799(-)
MAEEGKSVVTIAGVGSLVSEASAQESFDFKNFRIGEVKGWRRAFAQANWVNVSCGLARVDTNEVAALAMVPTSQDYVSHVALLDVEEEDLYSFYEREAGYRIISVPFTARSRTENGLVETGFALLCTACKDDGEADMLWSVGGEMERHCKGSSYVADWMKSSLRPLWPALPAEPLSMTPVSATNSDDFQKGLYPAPGYLRGCARAHARAGLLDHFLDSTWLADRRTTLRSYLQANAALKTFLEAEEDECDEDF